MPEKYAYVADGDSYALRSEVIQKERDAFSKELKATYKDEVDLPENLELLKKRQDQALNDLQPKVEKYQAALAKEDAALRSEQAAASEARLASEAENAAKAAAQPIDDAEALSKNWPKDNKPVPIKNLADRDGVEKYLDIKSPGKTQELKDYYLKKETQHAGLPAKDDFYGVQKYAQKNNPGLRKDQLEVVEFKIKEQLKNYEAALGAEAKVAKNVPTSDVPARNLFKSTTKIDGASGASMAAPSKPSLIQRLFKKPSAGMPAREDTKAFAKWLKDAHTPKELDNWNFVKQGQINRGRASIEKRQTALNDFIDRTGGSFTKADEAHILKESEILAKEQKALLDKVGRPHNVVEKVPGEYTGGVFIPERYVLKSVKPTAEEIAKDPKWAKIGASGNKSLNTFLKNTEGKVELVVDPVLLRTAGSSAGYVADTKSLIVKSIDTTTAKIESNLNYLHEIRHAKKNLDQNALESKLGRFARNDSDLVGMGDAELREIAIKQGKRLDMEKGEVEEVFTGLKGRRDQAEEYAAKEIDDLERKLSKNQLNGSFHAKEGKSISQFEGYEKYLSLDESTTYARGATQTSRLAEHRMLIEQSLGKDAVPADLAIRSKNSVMQNMVEGADASQKAARENLGLARKGIKDAEAVSSDGTTRIFETPTGAELKIKNSGGMLEAEIPLIKHGEPIGTYKVKVPAPEGRRLSDADMLKRLDDGIVKQQGEVSKAAKNAQNGIDKAIEVNKKEAAFAAKAGERPLASAKASPVERIKTAASSFFSKKEADTVAEVSKEGWVSKYLSRNKISEDGKAKAREIADLYKTKELDLSRPAALQKEIDQHRRNIAKQEKSLLNDFTGSRIAPNNKKALQAIKDKSEKLADEQVLLMQKVGRPDNKKIFVEGRMLGNEYVPPHFAVGSVNPYREGTAKEIDAIYKASDRGISANKALDGFILKNPEASVVVDPLSLHAYKASGFWDPNNKQLVLPALESKSAKISLANRAAGHEADHGARNLADERRLNAAYAANFRKPPPPYYAEFSDDMVRKDMNNLYKGHYPDDEIERMVQQEIKERDEFKALSNDIAAVTANPTAADKALGRTNFEGRFEALEGKSLKNGGLYDQHQSLDEIHTFARDLVQNESVKEQANFIRKALGLKEVPREMLNAFEPGAVSEFNKMANSTRNRLQDVRGNVEKMEIIGEGSGVKPVQLKTPQGDIVEVRREMNVISAELPVYRNGERIGTFHLERPKIDSADMSAAEIKKFLGNELDTNLQELDAAQAKVANRIKRDNPLVERYREGSETGAQIAENSKRRAEGVLARDESGNPLDAEILGRETRKPSEQPSGAAALERPTIEGEVIRENAGGTGNSLVSSQRLGADAPKSGTVQAKVLEGEILYPAPKAVGAKKIPLEGRVIDGEVISAKTSGAAVDNLEGAASKSLVPSKASRIDSAKANAVQPKVLEGEILYPAPKTVGAKKAPLEGRVIDGEVISLKTAGGAVVPAEASKLPEVKVFRPNWKTVAAPSTQLVASQSGSSPSSPPIGGSAAAAAIGGPGAAGAATGLGKKMLLGSAGIGALGMGTYGLNQLNNPTAQTPADNNAEAAPVAKLQATGAV
ncbi:MAG: hypothetical protein EOP11_09145, partial [Proteobacteria bacterium]